ncbi:MAG: hypothetical protein JNM00_02150, partial [Flavobacteriales bacterium]|nr:hypothetical protein [Flavobacteriales bacterium]
MRVLYILIPIFVFSACRRDEPTRWTVDLAVPIAHGSLGLDDLVADSLLYADATGLWHLAFDYSLTGFDVDSLVEMPDTTIEKLFEVPLVGGPYDVPAGQEIINQDENTTLSVNNVELKEAIAKQGTLEYTVKSYVNGQLQCIYSLPGITLNGVPVLIDVHTMPGNQFIPFEFSGSINLSGYHFDLTGESGTASNQVFSNLIVKVDPLATAAAQVSGGDQIEITLKFVDPVVQYARGYFGQHLYEFNESIDVSGDMQFPSGVLNLEQAALSLEITNAVGADAIVDFGTIRAINHENNSYVLLNHSGLLSPLNITRAFDNNGWIESTSVSELVNQSNSNLISFLEVLPDELAFNGKIEVNPL